MRFNELLEVRGIRPKDVALCLHKPSDPTARRALAVLAEERPELFDAYQSHHSRNQEATVRNRPFMASFLAPAGTDTVFVGLYRTSALLVSTKDDWLSDPVRREMLERTDGHLVAPETKAEELAGRTIFHLEPVPEFADLARRLVCRGPGDRNYMRLADRTPLDVLELKREAKVSPPMPDWKDVVLRKADIQTLPQDWAMTLANWRGIYLLVDEADGARYVGSAYGTANLLGRWSEHVKREVGVTVELQHRDPAGFRFTILELLSPTASMEEVVAIESQWKRRLDTIMHGLNGN